MFTIEQIQETHKKVKSGSDFPQYVQDLKSMGVNHYEIFVSDGRTIYYGADNFRLVSEAKYPAMDISEESSSEKLKHAISIHQQGKTDYPTFCRQAADAGVEKWITHMIEMTVIYYDRAGEVLTNEPIPQP